jgi:hypothetical protein
MGGAGGTDTLVEEVCPFSWIVTIGTTESHASAMENSNFTL